MVAVRTEIIGTFEGYRPEHGENLLTPVFVEARFSAASAGSQLRMGNRHAQQLLQGACPGTVHGTAHQPLNGFQIYLAGLAPIGENHLEQPVHFLTDFLLDDFRRFFSCGVSDSSTGRARQICSFTDTKARFHSWY